MDWGSELLGWKICSPDLLIDEHIVAKNLASTSKHPQATNQWLQRRANLDSTGVDTGGGSDRGNRGRHCCKLALASESQGGAE